MNNLHYNTKACQPGQERQIRKDTLQRCFEENQVAIRAKLKQIKATTFLPYLGNTIAYNNSDWAVLYSNPQKYKRRCEMV